LTLQPGVNLPMRKVIVIVAGLAVFASLVAAAPAVTLSTQAKPTWSAFWLSVKVDLPPPPGFLASPDFHGKILNLTVGHLSDRVVRQWIEADLRRGQGDAFATYNLRRDIADAGIFGPPGLNGTSDIIDSELAKGVARIEWQGYAETVAAAVIWLSKEQQQSRTNAGYTEYVIVTVRRMTGRQRTRVYKNGVREPFGKPRKSGELTWQLDTGHFFTHPVLGPLWYQQAGWTCYPNDGTPMGAICGRVQLGSGS
jgi:hypothetical protein